MDETRQAPAEQAREPGLERLPLSSRLFRVRPLRQLFGVLLLAAVALSTAFLLAPARISPLLPGDEALGTLATATIRADRDYDVLDAETTELKRADAARGVVPVYDFEAGAADLVQQRIAAAFDVGRAAIASWQREHPSRARRTPPRNAARRQGAEELELQGFLAGRRDEFVKALQAVVDDEDYLALAAAGFDMATERAAERLAAIAGSGYTVAERELLAAERERGIAVRSLPGDERVAQGERLVRDVEGIRDLAQVRNDLDRAAPEQLSELSPQLRRAVLHLVRRTVRPNLSYDDAETRRRIEAKRAAVKDVVLQIKRGEKIVGDGEPIGKGTLLVLHAIAAARRGPGADQIRWGGGLFALLLCGAVYTFARRNVPKFRPRGREIFLLAALLVGQLLLVRGALASADLLREVARGHFGGNGQIAQLAAEAASALVPYAAGSMLVSFLLTGEAALVWTATFAPLCGLLVGAGPQPAILALVGGLIAADRVAHAGSRAALFRAGLWTALANVLVLAAFALFQARFFSLETAAAMAGGILSGALLAPLVTLLASPACEALFGVTSDLQLLALASFNHPLLKDLIVQAPGTYHQSIVLGALVEQAAREIGANPLLARVSAYYHDIGKGKNPLFFAENQKGENRHDQVAPALSAALVRRHVSDGLELARQARLPQPVRDVIAQHHGTRLAGDFYARALEDASRAGATPPADVDFRYPGPRPQTREAALVLLGDVVVATARKLTEVPPQGLQFVVERSVAGCVADGQLAECDLTQHDLERTVRAFATTLMQLYRGRPEAPSASAGPGRAALRVLPGDGEGRGERLRVRKP